MGDPGTIDQARGYETIEVLEAIAAERGVSAAQAAINYVRGKPGSPRSSSARGTKTSSPMTWRRHSGRFPPARWTGSTR